jgi:hypothetical protein
MNPQLVAAMILIPVLCGCDGSSAEDTAPMKTATYYTQNLPEANQVASRCKWLDEQKQRSLSLLAIIRNGRFLTKASIARLRCRYRKRQRCASSC